jgi:selenide,water dikinase
MMKPLPGVRLTLVLDRPDAVSSGMVPGFVAGDYRAGELEIDCLPLARRAGARVILAAATGLDPDDHRLELAGRPALVYDVISFDVGSTVLGTELPGVREHALATRPIRVFVDEIDAYARGDARRIAVVGAGAAGVELALCLQSRLAGEITPTIELIGSGGEILAGASGAMRARARGILAARGIAVRADASVAEVTATGLVLEDGERLAFDRVIWATGAAPVPLLDRVPLGRDPAGFLRVRETLQSVDADDVFAVGDCAALDGHPWVPRAGVYAVRQGPVLDANLRAHLSGAPLRAYRPQRDFLSLLNLGGKRALGGKWGLAFQGRWVFDLKDWIDRRFMRRFQVLDRDGRDAAAFPTPESMGMEEMACGGCAAKVDADGLTSALARLSPAAADSSVRIGLEEPDDTAAIETSSGDVLLATVDGFRGFTDDPWLVGRVAAENAVSDVDASGGIPRHALAWVTVPDERHSNETLFQVMAGVREELDARKISLVGGHSTIGAELMVGLAVLGELGARHAPFTKAGLRPGDRIVLTQPLGTGVLLAADMQGRASGAAILAVHQAMLRGNAAASRIAREHSASAVTDVSGFGLAVHLGEMLRASGVRAEIGASQVPGLPGAREALARGLRSSFHPQNEAAARRACGPLFQADHTDAALLVDPQTSGGLLIGIDGSREQGLIAALLAAGDGSAASIGTVLGPAVPGQPDLQMV